MMEVIYFLIYVSIWQLIGHLLSDFGNKSTVYFIKANTD
jgi:hypothetical protein